MTDAEEYEEGAAGAGAATTGGRAAVSAGSRVAMKESSGDAKSGSAGRGAGLGGEELKFDLGGRAGEAWENLTCVESEGAANEGTEESNDFFGGGAAGAGSPSSWAFRHGVDVPQLWQ